ncbi:MULTISPECIES: enoyl-CoA hydratase-related protein [Pseudonocardia]|uniref:Enoyl-CoA hydratase/isomerase family protein n=1 Tax=Pseudonocardia saturnea TaxID=33909 RepID=A0ABQ0RZ32_9PSEU|nr:MULTISPECIES: enoyl-CoA hydratase-related protein [Pseudonocardia]BBG02744.1 hypothetical protein Pdca_39530 [Pseudonocardia autotrophica]GEC25923.1 hypothetical protein PSA01_29520 [Pseudonocardia saturnea]
MRRGRGEGVPDADEVGVQRLAPDLRGHLSAARALTGIRSIRVPVIAAVNGAAAGGGLALALAADIRLASPRAKFSAAFVKIGLSAGDLGTSWLLPRLIGPAAAAEFAYTAGTMDAARAEETGLGRPRRRRLRPAAAARPAPAATLSDEAFASWSNGQYPVRGRVAGSTTPASPRPMWTASCAARTTRCTRTTWRTRSASRS